MTTAVHPTGPMYVIGKETAGKGATIYQSPVGIVISYEYFKACIEQVHEDAKDLYHTAEESTNSLGDGWAQTNKMNTSLIQKLRDLTQENRWAMVAICVLALAVVVLAILLVIL